MSAPPSTSSRVTHAVDSATLADVLERIIDKGLVIAGDIKIKIVDIELLSIQIRLVVCSVEKACEMGIDWWSTHPALRPGPQSSQASIEDLRQRLAQLEAAQAGLREVPPG